MEGQTWIFNERFVKTIGDQLKKLRKATTRGDASDVFENLSVIRNADENRVVAENDADSVSCSYSPGVGVGVDLGSRVLSVEDVYREYPRKVGKRAALASISKAVTRVISGEYSNVLDSHGALEILLGRTKQFAVSSAGQAGEFTPHPSTWFNQSRYLDDDKEWHKNGKKPDRHEQQMQEFMNVRERAHEIIDERQAEVDYRPTTGDVCCDEQAESSARSAGDDGTRRIHRALG
jgi:hypothetical protein